MKNTIESATSRFTPLFVHKIRTLFIALLGAMLISGCAGESDTTADNNAAKNDFDVHLSASQSRIEKATSENLIDLNQPWSGWTGQDSGITYNPESGTLRIPAASGDEPMVIGVQRFDVALIEATQYTLTVEAVNSEVAAIIFLFDATGAIVPLDIGDSGFSAARSGVPLTFVSPANVAGFYLQVQNAWQAANAADLVARLTYEADEETDSGTELINPDGAWTDWSGQPNGVAYVSVEQTLEIQAPAASEGNRYGIRRFDTPLVSGETYQLRTLSATRPGATTLLFLFDENGALVPFTDSDSGSQISWLSAGADQVVQFVAPDGISSFTIQVQSGWLDNSTTRVTPSLLAVGDVQSCTATFTSIGETTDVLGRIPEFPQQVLEHSISDDGRYIAFVSNERELIDSELNLNNLPWLYWYDRNDGTLRSVVPWNANSSATYSQPVISGDGRYIVFLTSDGTALDGVTNQNLQGPDLFRYDRVTQTYKRLTPETPDARVEEIYAVSSDGGQVLFRAPGAPLFGAASDSGSYLIEFDAATDELSLVDLPAETAIQEVSASGDFRYLALLGTIGDRRIFNEQGQMIGLLNHQIYLFDRQTGIATQVADAGRFFTSTLSNRYIPLVSSDGEYVVFGSDATGLVDGGSAFSTGTHIYRWSRSTDTVERVSDPNTTQSNIGSGYSPSMSSDGQIVSSTSQVIAPGGIGLSVNSFNNIVNMRTGVRRSVDAASGLVRPGIVSGDGQSLSYFVGRRQSQASNATYSPFVTELVHACN